MDGFHVINKPVVTSFLTTVEIRLYRPISIPEGKNDLYFWEERFIQLRDRAKNPEHAHSYDVCRATLKWAGTCGAQLQQVSRVSLLGNIIEFTFKFNTLEALNDFEKDFQVCVTGASS